MQIKEAIRQREEMEIWSQHKALEWQTKTLAAFIANTVEHEKGRKQLLDMAMQVSLTGGSSDTTKSKKRTPKTYKTLDGKTITSRELKDYAYDEIDHTEEDRERRERARKANANKNISSSLIGSFTRAG